MERLKPQVSVQEVSQTPKLRIGLRGVAGQLGSRICAAVNSQQDMTVSLGIGRKDQSFRDRALALEVANPESEFIFCDEDDIWVEQRIPQNVDVFIDATTPGIASRYTEVYSSYGIPVIVQSGDRSFSHISSPPKISDNNKLVRQGDCNVSGLTPVLSALDGVIESAQLTVIMQYGTILKDKPRDTRLHTVDFQSGTKLHEDLQQLFPELDFVVNQIVQVPGLRYYAHIIDLVTNVTVDKEEIYELLDQHPRIRCMSEVTSSFQVHERGEMYRLRGKNLPPITPLTILTIEHDPKHLSFYVVVDSRFVTVYPNVDLARILGTGVAPIEAMKKTDAALNFK